MMHAVKNQGTLDFGTGVVYNVLHIDDDKHYQDKIKESFENHQFNIDSVSNFESARREFDSKSFDAIILEYKLKDYQETGLEFLENIRNYNQNVTVIILTESVTQDIVIKAIRLSVDDFIPKPINFQTFPDLITKRIEKRKKLFNPTVEEKLSLDSEMKGNLFQNFLILKGSIPLVIFGDWNDETTREKSSETNPLSDNEFLMSGFLSAIQDFSSNYFGQTVDEISLANSKLVLISKGKFTACLKIENKLYKSMYSARNKNILINTIEKILSEVVTFYSDKNETNLVESFKNHINHILTESSIKTQIQRVANIPNRADKKKSYLKRLKESISRNKENNG